MHFMANDSQSLRPRQRADPRPAKPLARSRLRRQSCTPVLLWLMHSPRLAALSFGDFYIGDKGSSWGCNNMQDQLCKQGASCSIKAGEGGSDAQVCHGLKKVNGYKPAGWLISSDQDSTNSNCSSTKYRGLSTSNCAFLGHPSSPGEQIWQSHLQGSSWSYAGVPGDHICQDPSAIHLQHHTLINFPNSCTNMRSQIISSHLQHLEDSRSNYIKYTVILQEVESVWGPAAQPNPAIQSPPFKGIAEFNVASPGCIPWLKANLANSWKAVCHMWPAELDFIEAPSTTALGDRKRPRMPASTATWARFHCTPCSKMLHADATETATSAQSCHVCVCVCVCMVNILQL